ncbi:hypothetical protein [Halorussus ruber]|uniref:hypothetical protein n=1 Tax=Halorussus ruber TaxID=1126238 RepID=UPI001092D88D|nr:hypothetical protein [Halorussus ruber]
MSKNNRSRRHFLRASSATVLGSTVLTVPALGASSADEEIEPSDGLEERIRKTDTDGIYRMFSDQYDPKVARRVVQIWEQYTNRVLNGRLTEQQAFDRIMSSLKKLSPELRTDINNARRARTSDRTGVASENQRKVANSELKRSSPSVTDITTQDTQEILLIDGQVGGTGVGYRDSHYYEDQDIVTSIVETAGIGDLTQWAWLEGNAYIQNGGRHDIVCDYWQNGGVLGGNASYDIWVQEEGESYKTWLNLATTSNLVYGNKTRAVQYNFNSDTVYNFGIRLKTSISGIADALVDFQTVNADGSTRQLKINSLRVKPD